MLKTNIVIMSRVMVDKYSTGHFLVSYMVKWKFFCKKLSMGE